MAGFGFCEKVPLIIKKVQDLDNKGVHNFSWHILDAYFRLEEVARKNNAVLLTSGVLKLQGLPGRLSSKIFVYDANSMNKEQFEHEQKTSMIYSIDDLLLNGKNKVNELCYSLDTVFDKNSYLNSKKRHKRIIYPFTWIKKQKYTISKLLEVTKDVIMLHGEWVNRKLNDPRTFRMMFPNRRYINCVYRAVLDTRRYVVFGVRDRDEKLISVRVVGIQNKYAYDLAFFSAFWRIPSQATNYINVAILKQIWEMGVKEFNCGYGLTKNLSQFKKHYPHFNKQSFSYSRIKSK